MEEGPVSYHFNRRFSRPLAKFLAPTRVTPNQVTVASFLIALGAAIAFAVNGSVVGGLLAQSSSILDGADGDLARAQGTATRFGAFFDAVLDRYADAVIIAGMATAAQAWHAWAWLAGCIALVGSFMVSYTRARAEASIGIRFHTGVAALATRDVRLALICLGGVVGQTFWTLVVLGLVTNLAVIARLLQIYRETR